MAKKRWSWVGQYEMSITCRSGINSLINVNTCENVSSRNGTIPHFAPPPLYVPDKIGSACMVSELEQNGNGDWVEWNEDTPDVSKFSSSNTEHT